MTKLFAIKSSTEVIFFASMLRYYVILWDFIVQSISIDANERGVGTGNATIYTPGYGTIEVSTTMEFYSQRNDLRFYLYPAFEYSISSDGGGYVRVSLEISSSDVYTTEKNFIISNNGMLIRSSGKSYFMIENSTDDMRITAKGLPTTDPGISGQLYVSDGVLKISQ